MVQIISFIITAIIVVLVLRFYPEKLEIRKMTLTAILLSVALVLTTISLNLFIFGGQVVVRFSQLVLIVLGATLGPVYGLIGGLGFDVLNLLINPLGSFYIGFTLNNILVATIPAIIFRHFKNKSKQSQFSLLIGSSISYITYIVIVLLLFLSQKSLSELIDIGTYKMIITVIVITIMTLLLTVVVGRLSKKENSRISKIDHNLILLIASAILVEFIVQGILTPIWLYDMAKTPLLLSMQIRAIKGGVMVFLNSAIGFAAYKVINKRLK